MINEPVIINNNKKFVIKITDGKILVIYARKNRFVYENVIDYI